MQEAAEQEEKELTPDEMGRKIASQWTTDPEAAGSAQSTTLDANAAEEVTTTRFGMIEPAVPQCLAAHESPQHAGSAPATTAA